MEGVIVLSVSTNVSSSLGDGKIRVLKLML